MNSIAVMSLDAAKLSEQLETRKLTSEEIATMQNGGEPTPLAENNPVETVVVNNLNSSLNSLDADLRDQATLPTEQFLNVRVAKEKPKEIVADLLSQGRRIVRETKATVDESYKAIKENLNAIFRHKRRERYDREPVVLTVSVLKFLFLSSTGIIGGDAIIVGYGLMSGGNTSGLINSSAIAFGISTNNVGVGIVLATYIVPRTMRVNSSKAAALIFKVITAFLLMELVAVNFGFAVFRDGESLFQILVYTLVGLLASIWTYSKWSKHIDPDLAFGKLGQIRIALTDQYNTLLWGAEDQIADYGAFSLEQFEELVADETTFVDESTALVGDISLIVSDFEIAQSQFITGHEYCVDEHRSMCSQSNLANLPSYYYERASLIGHGKQPIDMTEVKNHLNTIKTDLTDLLTTEVPDMQRQVHEAIEGFQVELNQLELSNR